MTTSVTDRKQRAGAAPRHTMQCMEVWGSNRAVSTGLEMAGLDAWVYSRPCDDDDEGGDVHYISACATGRAIRAMVADVSGHGTAAAESSADLRRLMRRYVYFIDQRRVLRAMNRRFRGLEESGRFATAAVVTCWTPTDEVRLSLAGHPAPLHYDSATKRWQPVKQPGGSDIPLGVDKSTTFRETRLRLARQDMLLLYSDGLTESMNQQGQQLRTEGLLDLLEGLDPGQPDQLLDGLLRRVGEFRGDEGPADDVTLMLLRPNAMKPRVTFGNGVAAMGRVFRGLLGEAFGGRLAPRPG